jgi:hypothetical protein
VIAVRGLPVVLTTVVVAVLAPAPAVAVKDRPAPSSNAIPPFYSTATTFEVPYAASGGPGVSELAGVDLYLKAPGEVIYSLAATDPTPETPSFSYQAAAGDGTYAFYTVAVDQLGHTEAPPRTRLATVAAPGSRASSSGPRLQTWAPIRWRSLTTDVLDHQAAGPTGDRPFHARRLGGVASRVARANAAGQPADPSVLGRSPAIARRRNARERVSVARASRGRRTQCSFRFSST